jgi:hypothetical protein
MGAWHAVLIAGGDEYHSLIASPPSMKSFVSDTHRQRETVSPNACLLEPFEQRLLLKWVWYWC